MASRLLRSAAAALPVAACGIIACGARSTLLSGEAAPGGGGQGGAPATTTGGTTATGTTTTATTTSPCAAPWLAALSSSGQATALSVQVNAAGRVLVAGTFAGELDPGNGEVLVAAGGTDYFLVAYDACGEVAWARRLGNEGTAESFGGAAALGPDGSVVFAGTFEGALDAGTETLPGGGGSDVVLLRLDPSGGVVWGRRFGDADEQYADRVLWRPDGAIHVGGHFRGQLGAAGLSSDQQYDVFVIEADAEGQVQWGYQLGVKGGAGVGDMGYDVDGTVLVGAPFSGVLPFDPGQPSDGIDLVIFRVDGGSAQEEFRFGGEGYQYVTALAVHPGDGALAFAGFFEKQLVFELEGMGGTLTNNGEGTEAFVARQGPGVSAITTSRSEGSERVTGLAPGGSDQMLLSGHFDTSLSLHLVESPIPTHGGDDAFWGSFEVEGSEGNLATFGDAEDQRATAIASVPGEAVVVAGPFRGEIDAGFASVTAEKQGVFVVRYPGLP